MICWIHKKVIHYKDVFFWPMRLSGVGCQAFSPLVWVGDHSVAYSTYVDVHFVLSPSKIENTIIWVGEHSVAYSTKDAPPQLWSCIFIHMEVHHLLHLWVIEEFEVHLVHSQIFCNDHNWSIFNFKLPYDRIVYFPVPNMPLIPNCKFTFHKSFHRFAPTPSYKRQLKSHKIFM